MQNSKDEHIPDSIKLKFLKCASTEIFRSLKSGRKGRNEENDAYYMSNIVQKQGYITVS